MLSNARAGRGKPNTDVPLVLSRWRSPFKSMVPGRVRKSLVTPGGATAPEGEPV